MTATDAERPRGGVADARAPEGTDRRLRGSSPGLAARGLQGPRRRPGRLRLLARLSTGALIVVVFALPVLYVLMISFETANHYGQDAMRPPASLDLPNYSQAWTAGDIGRQLINTALYSVVASAIATVLALLIAYPIARRLIRGHNVMYGLLAVGLFLPFSIIPLFVEARSLGLYDNTPGYIILHIEPGMPLGVVLLTAFILAVPNELDEAAWLDGIGYLRYLARVIVPLTRPALLITFLYGMLGVWNDIIGPVALLGPTSNNLFPITRGIYNFYSGYQNDYPVFAAAIVLASLPLLAVFAATQRHLVRAAIAGSVKG
jgi:raffinose/stachyose/melibiose transport system permease protein